MADTQRKSHAFSDNTRTRLLLKSNRKPVTINKSPYLPLKARAGNRVIQEKKQMRSRLMEDYFETNRSELEVRSDLCFSLFANFIIASSPCHLTNKYDSRQVSQFKWHGGVYWQKERCTISRDKGSQPPLFKQDSADLKYVHG